MHIVLFYGSKGTYVFLSFSSFCALAFEQPTKLFGSFCSSMAAYSGLMQGIDQIIDDLHILKLTVLKDVSYANQKLK